VHIRIDGARASHAAWIRGSATVMSDGELGMRLPSARRRPAPTTPWASCTEKCGLSGKGTATTICSTNGESTLHHSRATHPHRGPSPQGAKGGWGGSTDQGYHTTSAGSQDGPRQGCGRWGGGDEHCVGPADVRYSVSLAAIPTAGRQRRRTRWKRGRALCHEVTLTAGVQPCSCMIVPPAPRHAIGHGRRRAFRDGLGAVMGHPSISMSSGAHVFTPRPCALSTRIS
jgi:hypothetical protein